MFENKRETEQGISRTASHLSTVTIFSLLGLIAGIIIGLLSARKPGKELKRDAELEMNKTMNFARKNAKIIKSKINKVKTDCKNVVSGKEATTPLGETIETIKAKSQEIGDNLKSIVKQ